jgi:DNA-binding NtrC family response regulator
MSITILIVDDEDTARSFVSQALGDAGYDTIEAGSLAQALQAIEAGNADVILLDVSLPDGSGLSLLERIARENPSPPVIIITAFGEVEMAVEAMKRGAQDFLQKPLDFDRMLKAVERAREIVNLRRELDLLRRASGASLEWVIGDTPVMQRLTREAQRAAGASVSVLITGETGTGKEVLAQAIRGMGPRADKPFVAINCAALPDTMIESELFGHEAGAFTGATKRKPGLLEVADGGILFLDEISSMRSDMQAKVLRVLDEQRFRRIGGVNEIGVDVQILAASNRDLQTMMSRGEFREDLYYRLKVVDLHLPPLRERISDIPALVGMFVRQVNQRTGNNISGITPRAIDALKAHRWPGNIRELRHTIERAMLFCDDEVIDIGHLPPEFQTQPVGQGVEAPGSETK